jgi:YihY family inner membrane protein
VSTPSKVPQSRDLDGEDARKALRRVGWGDLIKASVRRFVEADGTSYTRAFGHAAVLTGIPALIMLIGFASVFDLSGFRDVLESTLKSLAPGPSSRLLSEAFKQGSNGGGLAFVGGLIGTLYGGILAFAQVERGCNRIYGMPADRDLPKKLTVALGLTVSAGVILGSSFILLVTGGALGDSLERALGWSNGLSTAFAIGRWPVGILLAFAGLTVIYKYAPSRKQPSASWLQTGTIVATLLWFVFSAALGLYYSMNDQVSQAFGPLVGVIAVLTWAYATGLALFLGISFAAQLEAQKPKASSAKEQRKAVA